MDDAMRFGEPSLSPSLRIGDAERERAATALGEHYAAGRIDHRELDVRLDAIYAATTAPELNRWFADLPGPVPVPPAQPAVQRQPRGAFFGRRPLMGLVVVALVIVAVATVVSRGRFGPGFFVFPMMWVLFGGRRYGRSWNHPGRM
jgi:hypothetical protein